MAVTGYSSFWGGADAYSQLAGARSHAARKLFTILRHRSLLKIKDQVTDLIAASTGTQGAVTIVKATYTNGDTGLLGGARTIGSSTDTSETANTTGSTLKVASSMSTRPSYVADASGNGGGALA